MRGFLALTLLFPLCANAGIEQLFYCNDGESRYVLQLSRDGRLQAENKSNGMKYRGSYTSAGNRVELSVPGVFKEASTQVETGKGLYLTMRFPSLFCHVVGHDVGPAYEAYARCPDIRYIPSVSYEKNHFQFHKNHVVKRRRWRELMANHDSLYSEIYGTYLVEGDRVTMYFGDAKGDQLLTGRIINGVGIQIDQLEPAKGACVVQ